MDPLGETAIPVKSPLDKPLGELTEEDITQLTREDCRRFLRERGMRRPSWNKSQAIQQVISLKALLEAPRSNSAATTAGIHRKPPPPPPLSSDVPSTRADAICGDPSPYRRREPVIPVTTATTTAEREQPIPPESICPSPRYAADVLVGQLTIFYDGRVNVYEGVPAEKARAIMQLAASPGFDEDGPTEPFPSTRRVPCRFAPGWIGPLIAPTATTTGRLPSSFRESTQEWRALRETEPEGLTSREVSLQRYLEKRKDRFKGKRVLGASPPSNRDMMYLSQKFRAQTTNEQSSRSSMSSPTQPKPPCTPTRCSSMENKASKVHITIDLNEDGDELRWS